MEASSCADYHPPLRFWISKTWVEPIVNARSGGGAFARGLCPYNGRLMIAALAKASPDSKSQRLLDRRRGNSAHKLVTPNPRIEPNFNERNITGEAARACPDRG
jgi:hypothetical protein